MPVSLSNLAAIKKDWIKNPIVFFLSQIILIAAVFVRPPYAPLLWICGLRIMNLKHIQAVSRKSLLL